MARLTLVITALAFALSMGAVAACDNSDGSATATRIAGDAYATVLKSYTVTAEVRYARPANPATSVALRHAATSEAVATAEKEAAEYATREAPRLATATAATRATATAAATVRAEGRQTRVAERTLVRPTRDARSDRATATANAEWRTQHQHRAEHSTDDRRRANDCGLKSIGARPEYPFDSLCIWAIREGVSDRQLENLIDAELNHAVQLALDGWPSSACYNAGLESHRPRAFRNLLSSFCHLLFDNNFQIR